MDPSFVIGAMCVAAVVGIVLVGRWSRRGRD
jgi:hypothetical protein